MLLLRAEARGHDLRRASASVHGERVAIRPTLVDAGHRLPAHSDPPQRLQSSSRLQPQQLSTPPCAAHPVAHRAATARGTPIPRTAPGPPARWRSATGTSTPRRAASHTDSPSQWRVAEHDRNTEVLEFLHRSRARFTILMDADGDALVAGARLPELSAGEEVKYIKNHVAVFLDDR